MNQTHDADLSATELDSRSGRRRFGRVAAKAALPAFLLLASVVMFGAPADAGSQFTTRKYCSSSTFPVMVATMTNTARSTKTQGFGWSPSHTHPGFASMLDVRIPAGGKKTVYIHAGSMMGGRHSATFAVHRARNIQFSYRTYCSRWG